MDSLPLVSVITPLYNAEKYIAQTIESVLSQTYPQWEMLVVDNCSSDASKDIVKSFNDPRIKLIELEYNSGGPARPRNIGMEHAQGEYIAFLDSDDIWMPSKLQRQMQLIQEKNVDIVHTLSHTIDTNSQVIGFHENQRVYNLCRFVMRPHTIILFSNFININSVLMKKDENLRFREDKNLIALEDWTFWIENNLADKKIHLLPELLLHYRIDINSASNRSSDMSFRKAFYLYALLLIESKISYGKFCFAGLLNFIRIGIRNLQNSFGK